MRHSPTRFTWSRLVLTCAMVLALPATAPAAPAEETPARVTLSAAPPEPPTLLVAAAPPAELPTPEPCPAEPPSSAAPTADAESDGVGAPPERSEGPEFIEGHPRGFRETSSAPDPSAAKASEDNRDPSTGLGAGGLSAAPGADIEPPAAKQADNGAPAKDERHMYVNLRTVELPFSDALYPAADDAERALKAVVLYVSGNRGRTWVRAQKRALPAESTEFVAANDGEFWCLWRREKRFERGSAPAAGTEAQRIVTVDTEAPRVARLEASPVADDGTATVTWEVEDRSPLVAFKAVAIHDESGAVVMPDELVKATAGRARFRLTGGGLWHVGTQFVDAAGNAGTAMCDVRFDPPAPVAMPAAPPRKPRVIMAPMDTDLTNSLPTDDAVAPGAELEPAAQVRARQRIAVLPSRVLKIGYRWDAAHPPSRIGLWVTRDGGRTWRLDRVTDTLTGAFVFQAGEDGVYGFTTHRELGQDVWDAPHSGVAPEQEIIVDTTSPQVAWTEPLGDETSGVPGRAPARVEGMVPLRWRTVEANACDSPVTLAYRAFARETWQPIAGPMADTGRHDWQPPDDVAGPVEVRITLRDRAGHVTRSALPVEIAGPGAPSPDGQPVATASDTRARDAARRAYAMATLARLQENWEAAEKHLGRATALDPTYGRAWVDLGGIYLHSGRWESAADVYRKALQLEPDSGNAGFGLARALASRGDLSGAAETLDKLLQRSPNDADGWLLYGDVLYKSGNLERARQCWLKSMGLGGGHRANVATIRQRLELKR